MLNTNPWPRSQCQGNPFHQHCERKNITNTIPRLSIPHTSLGCPIHRPSWTNNNNNKTCFVHVFPSDIKPRFLKNLPHLRVRSYGYVIIWEMAAETKTNNNNQQTNSQCWGSPFHQHCETNDQTNQTCRDRKRSCTIHFNHNPWKLINHRPIFPVASEIYTGYAGWTSNHIHGYSSSYPIPTKTLHQVASRLRKGWNFRTSHSLRCPFTGLQPPP